ncbi:MAG: DciA family protein [Roseinatronobacter sp.]|nr:DciA family protein [Roseinatronobacter sp.]
MAKKPTPSAPPPRRARGFVAAAQLMAPQIRIAGEARGFAVARLLTHWAEIAGADIAALCRPAKIGYGKGGLGATLSLLTTGAAAPLLQMQLPQLRARVNACYGYNAIARITLTQTAPTGFAEGQAEFTPAPKRSPPAPAPEISRKAAATASVVQDAELRTALERLARNVLSKAGKS